jgi:abortive infection bacteriophage resistance protein
VVELKRHLTYETQIELLQSRGLGFENYAPVLEDLKRIGYYRFSGYSFPLRDPESLGFARGAKFEHAIKFYEFDSLLRNVLLKGLSELETAFCAQVSYVLGKRNPEGHLYTEFLDEITCSEPETHNLGKTKHEAWLSKFRRLESFAKEEDFVRHHKEIYKNKIPIWVATEFMDFGNTVRLFHLMKKDDRYSIAKYFNINNDQAGVLESWMISLNGLRNKCSHHNRVWNAKYAIPKKPAPGMVDQIFQHYFGLDENQLSKIYSQFVVLAYLLLSQCNSNTWAKDAKRVFLTFGDIFGFTLENSMGFPEGWESLTIWN